MSSEKKTASDAPADLMRHWFEMASHVAEACQKWAVNPVSPEAMHEIRSNVFKVWGDYWEHVLRSSSFLDAEKQSMTSGLEFRKQIRDYLGQLHHEMQLATAPDIDQLMSTLRTMKEDQREQHEQVCLALNNLSLKLDAITQRLNALENKTSSTKRSPSDNQHQRTKSAEANT